MNKNKNKNTTATIDRDYLSRVFRTVYEMLTDRGYTITSHGSKDDVYSNVGFLPQPFTPQPKKCMEWMKSSEIKGQLGDKKVVVNLWLSKLGVKEYNQIMSTIKDESTEMIIISTKQWITPYTLNMILQNKSKLNIEIFEMVDLVYNITHHFLQPKIQKITDLNIIKQVNEAFVQDGDHTKHRNLRETDPLIRYFNGKPGDMFKVILGDGRVHYVIITV